MKRAKNNDHVIEIYTGDLLSKWGFEDGHIFDVVINDYIEDSYENAFRRADLFRDIIEHFVISKVVNEIELCTIISSHNPVRAITVDDKKIDSTGENEGIELKPSLIRVTYKNLKIRIGQWFLEEKAEDFEQVID